MDRQPPTNPGVDPQKKNAPADVAASREQVFSEEPSTRGMVTSTASESNRYQAFASGRWSLNGLDLEVDMVRDTATGETLHCVRIRSLFAGFESSSDLGNSSRSLGRLLNAFNDLKARPIRYSLPGQGWAQGFTSAGVVELLTHFVDAAIADKLRQGQRKYLPMFRAIEKALVGEAIDSIISRACGSVTSDTEAWQRIASRLEAELTKAVAQNAETAALVRTINEQLVESRKSLEEMKAEHAELLDNATKVRKSKADRILANIREAGRLTAKATKRKYSACRLEIEGFVRAKARFPRDAKCSFASAPDHVLDDALLASEQELARAITYYNSVMQEPLPFKKRGAR
jgi:hypothetical protein